MEGIVEEGGIGIAEIRGFVGVEHVFEQTQVLAFIGFVQLVSLFAIQAKNSIGIVIIVTHSAMGMIALNWFEVELAVKDLVF